MGIRKTWKKIMKPSPYSLPETRARADRYQGMSKLRYMLVRGWSVLVTAAMLVTLLTVEQNYPWYLRLIFLLILATNAWSFARWESSWQMWQDMRLPTVEQAEQVRDAIREQADHDHDPFTQQLRYEVALDLDRWISGKLGQDDR